MVKWKDKSFLLLVLSVSVISAIVPLEHSSDEIAIVPFNDDDPSRLPKDIIPVHYDISLTAMTESVFSGARNYTGSVKILIQVVSSTDTIVLHNDRLTVTNVNLINTADGNSISNTFSSGSYDFLHIDPTSMLNEGQDYILEIDFYGNTRTDNLGFYRSQYRNRNENVFR